MKKNMLQFTNLMAGPVQERLIAIAYEALDQETCLDLHTQLLGFFGEQCSLPWNLSEQIRTPMVSMPKDSFDTEAPDWSKMKMFVNRCYRYQREDKRVLVQLCKDFMTINVAASANEPCPSFDILDSAFVELLPFIRDVLISKIRLKDLQYEIVYRLTEQHLGPLLSSRYHPGKLDYLDVFGLLRSFDTEVNRDDWELDIPLRQELVYHVKNDQDMKRLRIDVFVNHSRDGWFANIDFKAFSKRIQDMRTSNERLSAFQDILPQYDEFQKKGLQRLLSDGMYERIGGGQP